MELCLIFSFQCIWIANWLCSNNDDYEDINSTQGPTAFASEPKHKKSKSAVQSPGPKNAPAVQKLLLPKPSVVASELLKKQKVGEGTIIPRHSLLRSYALWVQENRNCLPFFVHIFSGFRFEFYQKAFRKWSVVHSWLFIWRVLNLRGDKYMTKKWSGIRFKNQSVFLIQERCLSVLCRSVSRYEQFVVYSLGPYALQTVVSCQFRVLGGCQLSR